MGHDFTLEGVKPAQFFFGGASHTAVYVEGLATALAMYVAKMVKERASLYNISGNIVNNVITLWHFGSTPSLNRYVRNGAHYDDMNPDVLDEMIDVICTKYGYDSLYRFYSLFLPRDVPFSFTIDTDAKQATVFVAALSAATGADLRQQFREWGFPIDDEFYMRIWDEVNRLVNQRVHTLAVNFPWPSPVFWVKVDYANRSGSQVVFRLPEGKHNLYVPAQVQAGGLRYIFEGWSDGSSTNNRTIELAGDLNLTARYSLQVRVNVSSTIGETVLSGWYEAGRNLTVTVPETILDYRNGTRRIFRGWYENGSLLTSKPQLIIIADKPRTIVASWETEYEVKVLSDKGEAGGTGWYKAGTRATATISPIQIEKDLFTNYVFEGWKINGEMVSTSPTYSFTVNGPATLIACWKTEPSMRALCVGVIVAILLVAIVIFLAVVRRKR
jgi:hypothetical protein